MTEQLTGILIDPKAKEITEVTLGTELQDIYDLLECDIFTPARIGRNDWIYLDDMGGYSDDPHYWICTLYNAEYPLINRGLILGDGESCTYDLETVEKNVYFAKTKMNGSGD